MIQATYIDVLKRICPLLSNLDRPWAITGSMGMALQGVDIDVHDIDIQTDSTGAYLIQDQLADHVVSKVRYRKASNIRSHYGKFRINGIDIEVMGDIEKLQPDGQWTDPPDLLQIIRRVKVGALQIPVLDLEYEKRAYSIMGRDETVAKIEAALRDL